MSSMIRPAVVGQFHQGREGNGPFPAAQGPAGKHHDKGPPPFASPGQQIPPRFGKAVDLGEIIYIAGGSRRLLQPLPAAVSGQAGGDLLFYTFQNINRLSFRGTPP